MNLAVAVTQIRKQKGMTQSELAEKMGVNHNYISMVEVGKRTPSMDFLDRLSYATKTPIQIIFWNAMSEDDIKGSKKEIYKVLKPVLDSIINELT